MIRHDRRAFIGALLSPALVPFVLSASGASVRGNQAVLTPEEEEGPFYIPGEHYRSVLAEGHPGVPLAVRIRVLDAKTGTPIHAAAVDIWHCDALGEYSGYDAMQGPPPMGDAGKRPMGPPKHGFGHIPGGPMHAKQTNNKTFLRGIQMTDRLGLVRFSTIFPGYYAGRTNHIHLKVHLDTSQANKTGRIVHTGQMFFPEDLARTISERQPYASHHIERTTQRMDHVFTDQHGASSMATIGHSSIAPSGYVAALTVVVS